MVDASWYRDWLAVIGDVNPETIAKSAPSDQGTVFPKFRPLSNRALVEDGKLKRGLKEKHDFFAISPALWAELVYQYGSSPKNALSFAALLAHRSSVAIMLGQLSLGSWLPLR